MKALVIALTLTAVGAAQESQRPIFFLGGSFGVVAAGGYNNPLPGAAAGIEHTGSRHYTRIDSSIVLSHKKGAGGGYNYNLHSRTYFGGRAFLVGGGAGWGNLVTPQYNKSNWHPFLGGMFRGNGWDVSADYVFSGTDRFNHVHGLSTIVRLNLRHRFRLREQLGIYRFHPTLQPAAPRRLLTDVQGGVEYVF